MIVAIVNAMNAQAVCDVKVQQSAVPQSKYLTLAQPEKVVWNEYIATAYCSCKKCCASYAENRPVDDDGNEIVYTASGERAVQGVTFVAAHTHDITAVNNGEGVAGKMDATSLNTAMQKACGDNKSAFSLAIMHSVVATNLENLKLLTYLKYTDAQGMEREIGIATLNGRTVLVDDTMPVEETAATYKQSTDTSPVAGKTYYTKDGTTYTPIANPSGTQVANYEVDTPAKTVYTTYILGDGAIEYTDCGARVPYEVDRDPKTNGGQDTLYSRQRKSFAPFGISFTMASMAKLSPTDAELETGTNWELVNTAGVTGKEYIAHKTIPIARIVSLG